jgi:hypothetical protein
MFIDHKKFPFLEAVINNASEITEEYHKAAADPDLMRSFLSQDPALGSHHVEYWIKDNNFHPENVGYEVRDGIWKAFPLFKIGFPINFYKVKEHFPVTVSCLKNIPCLNFVSFMRLDAGAKTMPHKHLMKNYIFHMLINDLKGDCEFYTGNETKKLSRQGDALLFEVSEEHSSHNKSQISRIDLTIDFDPQLFL